MCPQGIEITDNAIIPLKERAAARGRRRRAPGVGRVRHAIGRQVYADEVAAVATFLASPLAAEVTGEVISVTGGAGSSVHF